MTAAGAIAVILAFTFAVTSAKECSHHKRHQMPHDQPMIRDMPRDKIINDLDNGMSYVDLKYQNFRPEMKSYHHPAPFLPPHMEKMYVHDQASNSVYQTPISVKSLSYRPQHMNGLGEDNYHLRVRNEQPMSRDHKKTFTLKCRLVRDREDENDVFYRTQNMNLNGLGEENYHMRFRNEQPMHRDHKMTFTMKCRLVKDREGNNEIFHHKFHPRRHYHHRHHNRYHNRDRYHRDNYVHDEYRHHHQERRYKRQAETEMGGSVPDMGMGMSGGQGTGNQMGSNLPGGSMEARFAKGFKRFQEQAKKVGDVLKNAFSKIRSIWGTKKPQGGEDGMQDSGNQALPLPA